MVLTPARWFLLALLTCAALAVAYLPPGDIAESRRWSPYAWASHRESTRTRLAFAAERWAALSERDALRKSPVAGDVPVLILRGDIRPEVGAAVDSLIRNIWRRAPRADSTIRLRVVASAYGEQVDLWTAALAPEVVLPDQTDGRTCLVVLPAILQHGMESQTTQGWWRRNLRRQVEWAVAPCVLRAALGQPGPEIARWLAARGYDLASSIGWAVGGNAGVEYQGLWDERFALEQTGMPQLMLRLVGELPAAYQSTAAARCAADVPGYCADLVTALPGRPRGSGPMIRLRSLDWGRSNAFSAYAESFLSDLIEERGLEKFRRFWTSASPVNAAFSAAYGMSLDDWTQDWVRRSVGSVELGAAIHPLGALAGILASLLVVGASAAAAASREIG